MILQIMLMVSCVISMNAQAAERSEDEKAQAKEDAKIEEWRKKIGIDYSMPDFSTSKIDGKVIGTRLAKMLEILVKYPDDYTRKSKLSFIQTQQIENLNYVNIVDYKIKKIEKNGDEISILFRTKFGNNPLGIRKSEFTIRFFKGVSDCDTANSLFYDLSRYIKE